MITTIQQIETFSKSLNKNSIDSDKNEIYDSFLDCILIIDDNNNNILEQLIEKLKSISNIEYLNSNNINYHFIKLLLISIQRIINNNKNDKNNNNNNNKLYKSLFHRYIEILEISKVILNQDENHLNKVKILEMVINNIKDTLSLNIIENSFEIVNDLLEKSNLSMISILEENDENNIHFNVLFNLLNKIYNELNNNNNNNNNNNKEILLVINKFRDIFIKNSIELLKKSIDTDIRNGIISTLLLPLINDSIETFNMVKEFAYKMISDPPESLFVSLVKSEGFKLLSNLFNSFYKNLIFDPIFWQSIINGLNDINDSLNRKRSSYLLKKSIKISIEKENEISTWGDNWSKYFKWSKEDSEKLQKLWNTFFLIYESLDDFTIHLIQPVWKEIDSLVIGSSSSSPMSSSSKEGLDFEWVEILFKRCLNHQNPAVIKVLIIDVLNSKQYIPYLPIEFISGTLIQSISNAALYKGVTESTIHVATINFFTNYYQSLSTIKEKSKFIQTIINCLVVNHFQKELLVNIIKFIETITNQQKLKLTVLNNEFFPVFLNFFEISIKRLHSNVRNRIYKSIIKSLIYLCDENNQDYQQLDFNNKSKIIYSIPLHFHTNLKYNQLLNNWLNSINHNNNNNLNNIKLILNNYKIEEKDNLIIIDKDLIIKIKQESFIISRMILYLNSKEFSEIINEILIEISKLMIKDSTSKFGLENMSFNKFIILLGSILSITELSNQIETLKPLFINTENFYENFLDFLLNNFKNQQLLNQLQSNYIPTLEIEESLYLIQSFIIENILNDNNLKSYKIKLNNYLNQIFNNNNNNIDNNNNNNNIKIEIQKVIYIQKLFGIFKERSNISKLFKVEEIEKLIDFIFNITIQKPKQQQQQQQQQYDHSTKETLELWGNINSYFIKTKWMLIRNLLTCQSEIMKNENQSLDQSKLLIEKSSNYLEILIDDLSGSNFYCSQPIFHCLTILLPIGTKRKDGKIGFNKELFENCLSYAWTSVMDSGTLTFIGSFIQLAYQHDILSVCINDEEEEDEIFNHHNLLKEYFYKLLNQSSLVIGLYNLLIMKTTMIWKEYPEIAILYVDEIYESLVFGPNRTAGNELHQDDLELTFHDALIGVPTFVFNLHQDSICESAKDQIKFGFGSVPHKDSFGRAIATVFLYEMGKLSKSSHENKNKIIEFINLISMKLLNSNFDKEFLKKKEYILNTPIHRLKVRIWQSLCILSKFIQPNSNEQMNEIGSAIVKIFHLFNLPSIRKYVNIFLVNFMKRHHEIIEIHLIQLLDNLNVRGDILSSIVVTAGYILLNIENNNQLYQKVFNRILSLTTSGHQVVKTIASSIIVQIYDTDNKLAEKLSSDSTMLAFLKQLHYFFTNNQQAFKSLEKQKQVMDLEKKNQFSSSSFQNVFYDTPVLEQLSPSEIISPGIFDFLLSSNDYSIGNPLEKQLRDKLLEKSKYLPKVIGIDNGNENDSDDDDENHKENNIKKLISNTDDIDEYIDNNPTSYQKKILPWSNDLDLETRDELVVKKARQSIIIVASFIDKIPNLAGLARTCEIFNIECLVVSDLKIRDNKEFQNITVTAEKWLPMEEVAENDLKQYLLSKKSQGYSLLGVEQTSSSVLLNKFEFPQKSVLVLGKEKEGIPTEFINLLDKCIEIPQLGIIRSLNVHVSGSLMIWDYFRQQLNK
ncbi:hypothetical protein ACTFIW_002084 [Dictyostelium discoideum]